MSALKEIDRRIAELKKKKENLHIKLTQTCFKKMQEHAATELSPELILGFFIQNWQAPSVQQQRNWQEVGTPFFRSASSKKTQKVMPTDTQTLAQTA